MKFDSSSRVPHKFDVYECRVFRSRINKDRTNNEPNNISKHILEVVFVGYVARRWEIEGKRGILKVENFNSCELEKASYDLLKRHLSPIGG